ncbi:nitroreductase family protein [Sedimentibacter sp. MB31-C6]|uniref:nitroreductase family protein n=1 Tax=Sedimentibacter sp. MB31-C6 TaxID=3109366 RepID=UPI002DDCC826|nr:nitroreductase family protein [Sedimentibacter sp. MB36-C1]WSI05166.1 nitroreductase family protein [Sedimentibacter sp. MB36-C1]
MELIEAIKSRRSIRKFKSDAIPNNYIYELIKAARLAPSGTNLQPTRYVIIKSIEAKSKLKECTPLPFVSEAPLIIACCIDTNSVSQTNDRMTELREAQAFIDTPLDKEYPKRESNSKSSVYTEAVKSYLNLNAAIAIDHITLRAVDLGLGSCWVMMFDKEKVKKLLELDENYDVVALLPIGYPAQSPAQRPRFSLDKVLLKEI